MAAAAGAIAHKPPAHALDALATKMAPAEFFAPWCAPTLNSPP
jgi:hypothetical protein